ncbi:DNA mismatch repair protein MutS [Sphingorhabdus pulchriflava]|uniref:DNA mismatch repair protein MutS n=1 Tax=Sphingorhabdus pulchriflava TaxID=2292257 RepID=A0A371BHZ5_9SPHN|nr:Smr/MutS family protein [Sphingorhabdus pulchriflava]RDV07196.1 DNA mismatch repair protein MutS [Sphingorhabdus pulchriflava]
MARRLHPEERSLWNRVVETVKPLHPVKVALHPHPVDESVAPAKAGAASSKARTSSGPGLRQGDAISKQPKAIDSNLDSHWDRRFHKGAVIPDISIDLHGQGLAGAHARLDYTLEQAIHQRLRVVLLVTGKARAHDRTSGAGRGAIAAVVRDWLAASRHSSHIAAVRQAHPRHGGDGALYIVLKR